MFNKKPTEQRRLDALLRLMNVYRQDLEHMYVEP